MATTTYGTEYVQSSDLVSNWPGSSLSVANRIDDVSLKGNGLNNQTGTSYTLVLTDGGKTVTLSNASAVSVTIPTNASVAFPTGTVIWFTNKGAGLVTIAGAGGVTVNGADLTLLQNQTSHAIKLDTNTWVIDKSPSVAGLVKITDNTFSASSAVNINNCFSSTYDVYRFHLYLSAASTTALLQIRLRLSGTNATGANYVRQYLYGSSTTVVAGVSATDTSWTLGQPDATSAPNCFFAGEIARPALAQATIASIQSAHQDASANWIVVNNNYNHTLATAYDGLSLFPASGTISGTIRVYGYRN